MNSRQKDFSQIAYPVALCFAVFGVLTKKVARPFVEDITGLPNQVFFEDTVFEITPADIAYFVLIVVLATLVTTILRILEERR